MTSKAKMKNLAEDMEDAEVAAMLQTQPYSNGDQAQWLKDKYGDLDWAYTARVVRKWSHNALLTHIWEKSFSIPPREYNPSAPFVYVKLHDGEIVTLPHGYRLPLLFVAKYYWGITLSKLKDAESWMKERSNVFHLSRLCENLFQRARAKAFAGGMEKGWRCVMFDRLLARFYKCWYRNDPPAGKEFVTKFGAKEYDRDVLKHDWKRWCTRGLNGVQMKESEVSSGITIAEFREGLVKGDDGMWKLDGQPLSFITVDEDPAWSSTSELTDYDMDDEERSNVDVEGELVPDEADGLPVPTAPAPTPTPTPTQPETTDSPEKRIRELPVDEDDLERATKRTRIENATEEYHYPYHATYPLTRTLAAMAKNPVWATTSSASVSGSHISNHSPTQKTPSSPSRPIERTTMASPPQLLNKNATDTPRWSVRPFPMSVSASAIQLTKDTSPSTPTTRNEPSESPKSVVVVSRPKPKPSAPRRFLSLSARESSSRMASSSSHSLKAKTQAGGKNSSTSTLLRPTASKPRQTRASQIAGVATVNVYVSDGRPRGGAATHSAKGQMKANLKTKAQPPSPKPSRSPFPSLSNPPSPHSPPERSPPPESAIVPLAISADTNPTTVLPPPEEPLVLPAVVSIPTQVMPSDSETQPALSRNVITAKALELLVNLVDAKQLLSNNLTAPSSTLLPAAGTSTDPSRTPGMSHFAFEGRFQNLEERFSFVREELRDIVGRLQNFEKETREQGESKKVDSERVLEDKSVDCRPVSTTQGIQTDLGVAEDVEMGDISGSGDGGDERGGVKVNQIPERALGEIGVQTEEEGFRQLQQPDAQPEDKSKGDQTPTQVIPTAVEIHATDRNCGSETDTDSTVNALKDEPIDPRAQEMSSNLSLLVNNLVSAKMLSVVGDMLKGKAKGPTTVDLDASLRPMSPVTAQSSGSFSLSNLFDEVKVLKDESRARELRENEEMQALRQLHSAEVDALRRRLSYLESQNHHIDSGSSGSGQYRSSSTHYVHADSACQTSAHGLREHTDSERHSHQLRRPYPMGRTPLSPSGSGAGESDLTSSLDSISTAIPLPTPVHSERSFSFARPGPERDDDLPLPIKSQRKQHMSFPRSTFG